ncbi:MAG: ABC-F family ATP-binding cassette domain-containing protein [Micromonosporaceae bacterium]
MSNLVNLDKVTKGYDHAVLLDSVSLGLSADDRVGVVGLNGAGKTTLLRLLSRIEEPGQGRVTHRRDLRIRYLPQSIMLPPNATVGEIVTGTAWLGDDIGAEHEWASQSRVRAILDGLGMPGLGLDSPVGPMSGGERRRVALAALLVRPTDLLLLDEPTNHLDISGINWLAGWLKEHAQAVVVVTHDRWFLDAVCTTTWEVTGQGVESYEGGYAAWTLARAERTRQADAAEARRRNLVRKELAWLRRGAPARTSKPKFRIERANALIADVPPPRDAVSLRRLATSRLGRSVYDAEDVVVDVPGRRILDGVTWRIGPGDRIGLLGPNGAGKTTLLRLLAGASEPDTGTVKTGKTVRSAFLSQELGELPTELRVLEAVEEIGRRFTLGDKEISAAQLAEVFGFTQARLWTPVEELSGGERRRLQLLRLLAAEPNVLLLDEPTNDLDIDTLAALEDLLDGWPGTLIVASHDRYLIERVTDTVVALPGDGRLVDLPGGIDQYVNAPASTRFEAPAEPAGATTPRQAGGRSAGELRVAKKELARLERQVATLQRREATLHDQLAAHATDYQKLRELQEELSGVRAQREATEEEWLHLAEHLG